MSGEGRVTRRPGMAEFVPLCPERIGQIGRGMGLKTKQPQKSHRVVHFPRARDDEDLTILRMRARGMKPPEIARSLGLSKSRVGNTIAVVDRDYRRSLG